MARIPELEIERLKREVSLERVVARYGVELKPHGADLLGLCPLHEDHEPSLVVSPAKNLWHCLGACQAGGSVIDWVMRAEGVSFRHAVELLRQDLPGAAVSGARRATVRRLSMPLQPDAEDEALLGQVIGYYHETLKQSAAALAYLEGRGLRHAEAIERFKLGFANRTLGYRLPEKNRKAGAEVRSRLEKLGVLRASGHEHFNGSLVVPIFDECGQVVEVYGRKIAADHELRPGTPRHVYLPGPHRGVWNLEAVAVSEELILCEALLDALTFWCAGFRNVTASYGVEGFTKEHLEAMRRHGTRRVLIAYDRDEAGDRAAGSLAEKLGREGIECFRIQFPRGMDANAYAQKVQPAERSLELVIRQAAWMGKGAARERPLAPVVEVGPAACGAKGAEPAAIDEQPPGEDVMTHELADAPTVETIEREDAMPDARCEPLHTEGVALGAVLDERCDPSTGETVESGLVLDELADQLASDSEAAALSDEVEAYDDADEVATSPAAAPPAAPREAPLPSPVPAAPPGTVEAETFGEEVRIRLGDRRWRIRGLSRNLSVELLKVNLLVSRPEPERGQAYFVDTLDLYSARQRALFIKEAAEELGLEPRVIKRDLGKVLLKLEELQEQAIARALAPKETTPAPMPEPARAAALELLRDPRLLERVLGDFERCGVVGEQTNKLVAYLAAVSRKLEEPLAVVLQSSSAAGKTSLMESVLAFFPEEERVKYSAMTGQSLFYMGEHDLAHKILAIVEEEGAERASYALKLLQSERELTIASTGKDPATGRLVTHEYRVEGPVMIFLTTTAAEIDEELQNRCLVLTVDEEREQTQAIHRSQRRQQTLEGLLGRRTRQSVLDVHRNAQRLLRPLLVANPFAEQLSFLDSRTRTRRDHMKYLTLIRAVALLHQYQRPLQRVVHQGEEVSYIEVTLEDIAVANRLAHEVMGHSLDELAPQTRRLLELLEAMVQKASAALGLDPTDYRFTRREVREHTGWGATQIGVHLERLVALEYVIVHHGGRGQQFVYELVGGSAARAELAGLADVAALRAASTTGTSRGLEATSRGQAPNLSGTSRGQNGPLSAGSRGAESEEKASVLEAIGASEREPAGNAHQERAPRRYALERHHRRGLAALGDAR